MTETMIASEVAKLAGCSTWAVLDACNHGEFPGAQMPGSQGAHQGAWIIPADAGQAWAARYERGKHRQPLKRCKRFSITKGGTCNVILEVDGTCAEAENHTV